jgi:hypothetical protein
MTTMLAIVAFLICATGVALGVVGGRTVSIKVAPWTVAVEEYGQLLCTGVIIDPSQVLTAGHCVMSGESATPLAASLFTVEAGVSNFNHPLSSDHPQLRSVSAVGVMPGYIAARKVTLRNYSEVIGHDLALLTLSDRLELHGDTARAAYLPEADSHPPSRAARLVTAGFGQESPTGHHPNGTLNEVVKTTFRRGCGSGRVLCADQSASPCFGDSGSGVVEVQPRPTVVGIYSEGHPACRRGFGYAVFLGSPAALHFIQTSMRAPIVHGMEDRSVDTHTVIRPLPGIGIVCVVLGVLGVWRTRHSKERRGR